jgi:bifunctional DNA-binding transcriptional regulator/antitoxin component of YhaV-PrlF toxin-antitoxin module
MDELEGLRGKKKRVRISTQRQTNIPKEFYEAFNFGDEGIMELTNKGILIRPSDYETVDFSADILTDLVKRGYKDSELIEEFKRIKTDIPKALEMMKKEAMAQPTITGSLDDYLDALEDDEEDEDE